MTGPTRIILAVVAASAGAGVLGGCTYSSAAFPYDQQVVWQVAMSQAVVWHPDLIDDDARLVRATKIGLGDQKLTYEMKVRTDLNPFARRPSNRVYVRIAQRSPKRRRYTREEREFLRGVGVALAQVTRLRR